jgi:hypothetical protein
MSPPECVIAPDGVEGRGRSPLVALLRHRRINSFSSISKWSACVVSRDAARVGGLTSWRGGTAGTSRGWTD